MTRERETRRREKVLYFSIPTVIFSVLFEQGVPHFYFALSPENYVTGPVGDACCQDASSQNPAATSCKEARAKWRGHG